MMGGFFEQMVQKLMFLKRLFQTIKMPFEIEFQFYRINFLESLHRFLKFWCSQEIPGIFLYKSRIARKLPDNRTPKTS